MHAHQRSQLDVYAHPSLRDHAGDRIRHHRMASVRLHNRRSHRRHNRRSPHGQAGSAQFPADRDGPVLRKLRRAVPERERPHDGGIPRDAGVRRRIPVHDRARIHTRGVRQQEEAPGPPQGHDSGVQRRIPLRNSCRILFHSRCRGLENPGGGQCPRCPARRHRRLPLPRRCAGILC